MSGLFSLIPNQTESLSFSCWWVQSEPESQPTPSQPGKLPGHCSSRHSFAANTSSSVLENNKGFSPMPLFALFSSSQPHARSLQILPGVCWLSVTHPQAGTALTLLSDRLVQREALPSTRICRLRHRDPQLSPCNILLPPLPPSQPADCSYHFYIYSRLLGWREVSCPR